LPKNGVAYDAHFPFDGKGLKRMSEAGGAPACYGIFPADPAFSLHDGGN
jgi:hypothetical protein